ncbi:MAG: tetratricopeptide repeat protein [Planctomycetes bacterium]|nr:tetratricopeptide repeat protein [Planctomycetota bacterium]
MSRINWKLIIVLILAVVALGATAWGLRKMNRSKRSEQGLADGLQAYENRQWRQAADGLGRYLGVHADDAEILAKYAQANTKIRPATRNTISQAVNAYRLILRLDDTYRIDQLRREAAYELTKLYLQINAAGETVLIANQQLARADDPEIRYMLSLALARQRKFADAAQQLNRIITDDPSHIPAYNLLGQLTDQRPDDFSVKALHWFDLAVENNPESAQAYIVRGAWYFDKNQREKALADFQTAESLDLSDVSIRLALAERLMRAGETTKARAHLEAVEQAEPRNLSLWNIWALLSLKIDDKALMCQIADRALESVYSDEAFTYLPVAAELYTRGENFDKASECIERLRKQDAETSLLAFLEGIIAEQKGLWSEALKQYRQAAQLGLQSETVQLKIASAFIRLGDKLSALQQLRQLINKNADSYRGRVALIRLLLEGGGFAEAAEHARTLIRIDPTRLEGRLLYAQARMRLLGRDESEDNTLKWNSIESDLKTLDETLTDAVSVKTMLVLTAIQRGDKVKAHQMVDDLKKSYPDEIQPLLAEVDVLVAEGKYDQAIASLREITAKYTDSTLAVSYLVGLLARQQEYEECRTVLTDAISRMKDPEDLRTFNLMLAELYVHNNEVAQACELLRSVAEQFPTDIPIMRRLLRYSHALGQTDSLQPFIDRIKTIEGPDGRQWRFEQTRLWFALGADDFKRRLTEATVLLKENLESNPDDQQSRRLLASFYERAGQLDLAISVYRNALQRSPDDINIIIPTVAMMYKAQRYEQADEILERAIRNQLASPTDTRLDRLELQRQQRDGNIVPMAEIAEKLLQANPDSKDDRFTLALIRILQKDNAQARELLTQLRIQDPDYMPAIAGLVELNIRQDNPEEALRLCDETIQRLNNTASYILRSRAYVRLGDFARAQADMEKAIAMTSDNAGNLQFKAEFYRSIGRLDSAVETIRQALAMQPDDFLTRKQAIFLLQASKQKSDRDEGMKLMEKVLADHPDDADILIQKSTLLLRQGTRPAIDEAMGILKKIITDRPRTERAWSLMATVYLNQGKFDMASQTALRGISYLPRSISLLRIKASAEGRQSPSLAMATLQLAYENNPDDLNAAVDLARAYANAKKYDEAIKLLEAKSQVAKDVALRRIQAVLAAVLYDSGKRQQATDKFNTLYAAQSDDAAVLLVHVDVLIRDAAWPELTDLTVGWCTKNPDKTTVIGSIIKGMVSSQDSESGKAAEDLLRKIIASNSECIDAVDSLALLVHMNGRFAEAIPLYRKVIDLDPERLIAVNNLAWLLCEEEHKLREAKDIADAGLALNPNYIDLIDTRGMIRFRLNDFAGAVADFQKCIELYTEKAPGLSGSHFHLAKALIKLDRKREAIDHLKKAIELGGLSPQDLAEAEKLSQANTLSEQN